MTIKAFATVCCKFAIESGGAVEEDFEDGVVVPEHLAQGAPKKNREVLCPRQKRRESQKAFEEVECFNGATSPAVPYLILALLAMAAMLL